MSIFKYNAGPYNKPGNFEPLPKGEYKVKISDAEIKAAKTGSGNMLKLTFTVIEGPYTNRKLFRNLCVQHHNPEVVRLAQNDLNGVLHAIAFPSINNTDELLNKTLIIDVGITTGTQGPENRIYAYEPFTITTKSLNNSGDIKNIDEFDDVPF